MHRPDTPEEKWYIRRKNFLLLGFIILFISAFFWATVGLKSYVQESDDLEELKVVLDRPMNIRSTGKHSHEIVFSFKNYQCDFIFPARSYSCLDVNETKSTFGEGDSAYIAVDRAEAHKLSVTPGYDGEIELYSLSTPGSETDLFDLDCRNHSLKKDRLLWSWITFSAGTVLLILAVFKKPIL